MDTAIFILLWIVYHVFEPCLIMGAFFFIGWLITPVFRLIDKLKGVEWK